MLKIGHRGAKGYVAENTLASFQKAIDLGCDGIELDVWLSKDFILMVIHDATIDRTTFVKEFINNFTATELQQFGIPTLESVFNLVNKKCFINIEIKDVNATLIALKFVEHYIFNKLWNSNLIQISCFDWDVLELIASRNSNLNLGVLTKKNIDLAIDFAKKINAFSINPYYELLNQENVTLLKENGFKIYPWTVNEFSDIDKMKLFKVDGIISDFLDRI